MGRAGQSKVGFGRGASNDGLRVTGKGLRVRGYGGSACGLGAFSLARGGFARRRAGDRPGHRSRVASTRWDRSAPPWETVAAFVLSEETATHCVAGGYDMCGAGMARALIPPDAARSGTYWREYANHFKVFPYSGRCTRGSVRWERAAADR